MAACFGYSKAVFRVVLVLAIVFFAILSPSAAAAATPKPSASAPSPSSSTSAHAPGPSSDGTSIDQGIAYVLMILALVLTYLIHPLDASCPYNFF